MNNSLTEAKQILASNKTEQAARGFMTTAQRDALADDYASRKEFLSASHFASDAEETKQFERLFWENIQPKSN